jgi:hypothetical protein
LREFFRFVHVKPAAVTSVVVCVGRSEVVPLTGICGVAASPATVDTTILSLRPSCDDARFGAVSLSRHPPPSRVQVAAWQAELRGAVSGAAAAPGSGPPPQLHPQKRRLLDPDHPSEPPIPLQKHQQQQQKLQLEPQQQSRQVRQRQQQLPWPPHPHPHPQQLQPHSTWRPTDGAAAVEWPGGGGSVLADSPWVPAAAGAGQGAHTLPARQNGPAATPLQATVAGAACAAQCGCHDPHHPRHNNHHHHHHCLQQSGDTDQAHAHQHGEAGPQRQLPAGPLETDATESSDAVDSGSGARARGSAAAALAAAGDEVDAGGGGGEGPSLPPVPVQASRRRRPGAGGGHAPRHCTTSGGGEAATLGAGGAAASFGAGGADSGTPGCGSEDKGAGGSSTHLVDPREMGLPEGE